jgi:methionyl-tRNA synthetase
VSRTVSMIAKYRGGTTPQPKGDEADAMTGVADEGERMLAAAATQYEAVEITAALETVWEYVRRLNRLVEEEAPWKLAKDEAQAGRLDAVLHGLAAGLRLVAVALHPVIPASSAEILRRLGQPGGDGAVKLEAATWDALVPAAVEVAPPLFPRIERGD